MSADVKPGQVILPSRTNDEMRSQRPHFCSFCGKSADEVEQMLAGPKGDICNECVALCNEILRDEVVAPLTTAEKVKGFRRSIEQTDELIAGQKRTNELLEALLTKMERQAAIAGL